MILNEKSWPTFAASICAHKMDPEDYSPQNMENFMKEMKDYVVSVKGVRPQFKAHNSTQMIDFKTPADRKRYEKAYEKFLMERAKIEAKMGESNGVGNGRMQILVELLKFRQEAEMIKTEDIVDAMWDRYQRGEAPVASFNFKASIAKCVQILNTKYGVSRDDISLIWGGGNTQMSAKRKKKLDIKQKIQGNQALADLFEDAGIDMIDLGLNSVEAAKDVVIDDTLRLGPQSPDERQKEIDKFQKGKSHFCFFTFKSGGVGLSLHHTDELTTHWDSSKPGFNEWKKVIDNYNNKLPKGSWVMPGKVRRHSNGFAYVEDIPFIPTRPRRLFSATTYSAMELVQGLGRCPRLTSLSDTFQTILFYRGTIEERVAHIVSLKLRCLRKVVKQADDFVDVILGGIKDDDKYNGEDTIKQIENSGSVDSEDEEDGGLIGDTNDE